MGLNLTMHSTTSQCKGLSITNVDSEGRQGVSKNGIESQFYAHKLSQQGDLGSVFQVKIGQGVMVKIR